MQQEKDAIEIMYLRVGEIETQRFGVCNGVRPGGRLEEQEYGSGLDTELRYREIVVSSTNSYVFL